MTRAPAPLGGGRWRLAAAVAALALAEAALAAAAAFAVRALFARWHDGIAPGLPLAVLAGAALGLGLARTAGRLLRDRLGQSYATAIRHAVFGHVARMPLAAVEARRAGGLMLRFTGDLAALSGWMIRGLGALVAASVALPLLLVALAVLSPAAALGAAVPLLAAAGVMALAGRGLERRYAGLRRRRARLAADMGERLPLAPQLRLAGRLRREGRRLDRTGAALARSARRLALLRAGLRHAPEAAGGLAAAGAAAACWRAGAPAAELAGALAALGLALQHLRALGGVWDSLAARRAAQRRLDALLRMPRLAVRPARQLRADRPALRFTGVEAGPLSGVSLTLAAGEKRVLTGPTGAGKSTLLRLAAGLDGPAAGRVRVFGLAPERLEGRLRADAVLYLDAAPALLAGSLRRALAFGAPARPDDATLVRLAAEMGLGSLIARLGGLGGRIGEGGRRLSEGERARIGLVRLALSPARLVLVDRLDAALDAAGRAQLAALLAGREGAVLWVSAAPQPPEGWGVLTLG